MRATKSKRVQVTNLTSCSICCTFSFFSVQLLPHLRPSNPAPGLDSTPELKETPKEKAKTHGFVPVWGLQAGHATATGSGGQIRPKNVFQNFLRVRNAGKSWKVPELPRNNNGLL